MIQLLINDMQGHALRFRFLGLIYFLHHTEQNHTLKATNCRRHSELDPNQISFIICSAERVYRTVEDAAAAAAAVCTVRVRD